MVRVSCSLSEPFKLCHYLGLTRFRSQTAATTEDVARGGRRRSGGIEPEMLVTLFRKELFQTSKNRLISGLSYQLLRLRSMTCKRKGHRPI